jgi:hypothetical protein
MGESVSFDAEILPIWSLAKHTASYKNFDKNR